MKPDIAIYMHFHWGPRGQIMGWQTAIHAQHLVLIAEKIK